jgi:TPR repeat protein
MYEYGRGVGRSAPAAIKYYRKGCEAGNARSCDGMKRLNGG